MLVDKSRLGSRSIFCRACEMSRVKTLGPSRRAGDCCKYSNFSRDQYNFEEFPSGVGYSRPAVWSGSIVLADCLRRLKYVPSSLCLHATATQSTIMLPLTVVRPQNAIFGGLDGLFPMAILILAPTDFQTILGWRTWLD